VCGEQHDDPGEGHDEQTRPEAGRVGDQSDDGRREQEAQPHEPGDDGQPRSGRQTRQFVGLVHRGGHQCRHAEPGRGEAENRPGHRGHGQRQAHAERGDETAGTGHGALPEAVDEPVADETADELRSHQGDVAGRRERHRRVQ
jgi:hypothetical protein